MRWLSVLVLVAAACSPAPPAAQMTVFTAGDPAAVPAASAGGDGALGSGCAPGEGPLPDGAWFGYAVAWDATGVDFDLACYYVGDAAAAQAGAHNEEAMDFFVVNDTATTRRVAMAGDVIAHRLTSSEGPVALERTTYRDLSSGAASSSVAACPGQGCAVWLFINQGHVTEVMQQYFP